MLNLVFMGTPDFAAVILRRLADADYRITGVVTQPDRPKGRKKTPEMCDVKKAALELGLPVFQPERVRRPEALEEIRKMEPDLIVVAAFGQILPKALLDMPRLGCLNVHASLLPAYRGAAPIQYAILDGLSETGVTIMRMDVGLDTGDIISERRTPILDTDTGGSLFDRLADLGADLLLDTIPSVEDGTAVYTPQPSDSPTPYARMITREMGRIDWQESAEVIGRKVRAFAPWPSAFTTLEGKIFKIWSGTASSEGGSAEPGTILKADREGITVQCGEGSYTALEVQLEGKRRMKTEEFLRGFKTGDTRLG